MHNLQNLFHNKKIRSVYDTTRKTRWFSVVDVMAALRGTDYDTARKYWKQTKSRLTRGLKFLKFHQLKLTAKDGKQRFTDVMRYSDIIRLVQKLPRTVGGAFKKLVGAAAAGTAVMRKVFGMIGGELGKPQVAEFQSVSRRRVVV